MDPRGVEVAVGGRAVCLPAGVPMNVSLHDRGFPVESPCGGRGRCGRCRVLLSGPVPPPTEAERHRLTSEELRMGFRLSCQHAPAEGLLVDLVAYGLLETPSARGAAGDVAAARKAGLAAGAPVLHAYRLDPLVRKVCVDVGRPGSEDYRGDWERLWLAVAERLGAGGEETTLSRQPRLEVLRGLPGLLRQGGYTVTAVVGEGEIRAVEPGDTSRRAYGVAIDVGTTTLAASLVDLTTGTELGVASGPNPQAARGGDLMSRLGHAFTAAGREELRARIVSALNGLVADLTRTCGIASADVYAASVVGNTAMHHLFLGLEVEQLGLAPYVPAVTGPLILPAREAGLGLHPAALVYLPPNIAGFVGADLSAVLLATRLWELDGPRLVVDLGTNGEILLGDRTGILTCSAPAGPAFEGGAVARGMRAAPGAIQGVRVDGDVRLDVIGGVRPLGFCGSGLVDAVAELLRAGVLDPTGRLRIDERDRLPAPLRRRITEDGGGAFLFASPEEAGDGQAIALSQLDVRQLQLAKGAVRAGAEILLARRGIRPDDLAEVLLAGTFGNYIGEEQALAIGLIPPVPAERVRPIGNAAAAGALLALVSRQARVDMEAAVARVRHLPLAALPEFQDVFIESTSFPAGTEGWEGKPGGVAGDGR